LPDAQYEVCVLDDAVPLPVRGYGFPRALAVLRAIRSHGYPVSLVPLQASPGLTAPRDFGSEHDVTVAETEEEICGCLDRAAVIWVSRPKNLKWILRQKRRPGQVLIYDVEALNATRETLRRRLHEEAEEADRLLCEELSLLRRADLIICAAELDAQLLRQYGVFPLAILGHAIEPAPTPARFEERCDILFVGSFLNLNNYSPNRDAVLFLLTHIWPEILARLDCSLTIAGFDAGQLARDIPSALDSGRIRLVDTFTDPGALYGAHRVFVAPTRFAAGIPWKVHEAMSYGLPVVISQLLRSQLVPAGEGMAPICLAATTAEQFVRRILRCYTDARTWEELRNGGIQYVAAVCAPSRFAETVGHILSAGVARAWAR
jgi:O-antigen biosynthesis protein